MDVLSSRILLRPSDLDRSRRFYRDVLGLAICREFSPPDNPGVVFFLGPGLLEVSGHTARRSRRHSVMIWVQGTGPRVHAEHASRFSLGRWHHRRVDQAWNQFIMACQQALGELVEGRPEPFKALWSHAEDVVIMGAFGGYERGWEQVSARLDWAAKGIASIDRSVENVVTVVGGDLAYTVDLEHMIRLAGGRPQPRTLRCTQLTAGRAVSGRSCCATRTSFRAKTSSRDDPLPPQTGLA